MKRLCSICARGGSKGLKNKNIMPLLGSPLIAHTIEHAMNAGIFDAVVVSSDSEEILSVSKSLGVDFLIVRPEHLASDTAPKIPAIRHCAIEAEKLSGIQFDTFVDLDCTSPLRSIQDIIDAVKTLEIKGYDNLFSVTPARRSPYFDMVEQDEEGRVVPCKKYKKEITRRQDTPPSYDLNASIYVWNRETLMNSDSLYNPKTGLYIMPNERSVEIDSELEFLYTELLMKRR
ncbi:MAG: acylneuraminate cytidylyltransferase family protein [Candidatus Pacebacteria bacterium]|nr:acylneuraminate cytidylyltransferase family protein [Candidatus Paceibacterota bacterium]